MGLLANALERRSTLAAPSEWLREALLGPRGATGRHVGPEQALSLGAVYACVDLLAETIASLPWPVYRRLRGGGRERSPAHAIAVLLNDSPNPEMTAFEWREAVVGHIELWGNHYSEIELDGGGRPLALWPLRPDRMLVERIGGQERRLKYSYTTPAGRSVVLPPERVLHFRGLSPDGLIGYSRVALLRESIALGLALDEYATRFFGNDSRPGGVLEVPGRLSEDAQKRLKAQWESAHQGLTHAWRIAVLEEGISWKAVGIPPQDAQFLESRKYQRSEIASIFRVPPHLIGDVERSTSWGTGIEEQSLGFVTYSLSTRLVRLQQRADLSLLTRQERTRFYTELVVDALLRGKATERAAYLQTLRQNGVINADQWATLENLPRLPDGQGEVYLVPANLLPLGQLANPPPAPPPAPPPSPAPASVTETTGRPQLAPGQRADREYSCRECGHVLFSSPDERGRITTRCPDRRCRAFQTVLVGGAA